jgi:DNA-binding PadR family transcriptional regulator
MRRKAGAILPIEASILEAGIDLRRRGVGEFYGFLIAREVREQAEARLLTAHGTLYKALDRLEKAGFLASRWEDPAIAAAAARPRRRLYVVTAAGEAALANRRVEVPVAPTLRGRPVTP